MSKRLRRIIKKFERAMASAEHNAGMVREKMSHGTGNLCLEAKGYAKKATKSFNEAKKQANAVSVAPRSSDNKINSRAERLAWELDGAEGRIMGTIRKLTSYCATHR